ncbi:MAG TPA: hypothetical protein VF144_16755 [Chitinophagaceae bacterium]
MRFTLRVFVLLILGACSNADRSPAEAETIIGDSVLAWNTNADSMIMVRDKTIPDSAITINRIINGLNQKYPEVHVDFLKQSGDTAFVEVPDADYLGEQMGSAGAIAWYADAVINLTSVSGINYVSFRMDEHSHAGSVVIGRGTYSDWQQQ